MTTEPSSTSPSLATDVTAARIAAGFIDLVVLAFVGAIFTAFLGETDTSDGGLNFSLSDTPFILYVVVCFVYFIVLEGLTGRTLGKKLMGLRVVARGELSWGKVIVRNLLRAVDGLPFFLPYLVGVICVVANKDHQRIGDMAAGTFVVRVRAEMGAPVST